MILLTWFVFQVGFALARARHRSCRRSAATRRAAPGANGTAIAALGAVAGAARDRRRTSQPEDDSAGRAARSRSCRAAARRARARRRRRARHVFERHLDSHATIEPGTADLVVWPENVIDVDAVRGQRRVGARSPPKPTRLGVPFAVGITEDVPDGRAVRQRAGGRHARRRGRRPLRQGPERAVRRVRAAARRCSSALGAPLDLVPPTRSPARARPSSTCPTAPASRS